MIETDQHVVPGIVGFAAIEQLEKLAGTNAQVDNPRRVGFGVLQFEGLAETESLCIEADGLIHVLDGNCRMRDALDHNSSPILFHICIISEYKTGECDRQYKDCAGNYKMIE